MKVRILAKYIHYHKPDSLPILGDFSGEILMNVLYIYMYISVDIYTYIYIINIYAYMLIYVNIIIK